MDITLSIMSPPDSPWNGLFLAMLESLACPTDRLDPKAYTHLLPQHVMSDVHDFLTPTSTETVTEDMVQAVMEMILGHVVGRKRIDAGEEGCIETIETARGILHDVKGILSSNSMPASVSAVECLRDERIDPDLRTVHWQRDNFVVHVSTTGAVSWEYVSSVNTWLLPYYEVNSMRDNVIPLLRIVRHTLLRLPYITWREVGLQHPDLKHALDVLSTLTAVGLASSRVRSTIDTGDEDYIVGTPAVPWTDARFRHMTPLRAMHLHAAEKLSGRHLTSGDLW